MNEFEIGFNRYDREMVEIYRVVPESSFTNRAGELIKRRGRRDLFCVVHCDMFDGDIIAALSDSDGEFVKIKMEVNNA